MTLRSLDILQSVQGFIQDQATGSADRPVRLAVIDPAYDPMVNWPAAAPLPRVRFEGETGLSTKTYAVAQGYVPMPGDRCLMLPVGNTYQIMCKVNSPTDVQGFWSDGVDAGTEFGGGSYIDTDNGLVVNGDAEVKGDLMVSGIGAERFAFKPSITSRTNATNAADPHLTLTLGPGDWLIYMDLILGGTTGDIKTSWTVTGQTFYSLKTCWGPSPFTVGTATALEAQGRDAVSMRVGVHQYSTDVAYGMNSASFFTSAWERGMVRFATGGTVTLAWAQETTDAAASSVLGGSYMTARRLA